ncbi:MAG TPA: PAS domain S-box protein, partial [Chthoniobacterales bacterium]
MPESNLLDPAATDDTSDNARDGARKRRDPSEPSAVVGLGASAGGVAALQQFFSDMSAKSGLAFVVVMHLSPEHESVLANVIQQKTSMPVLQVTKPVKVKPNHVYVIPPNNQLTFTDSTLHLIAPQQAIGRRVTIDLFFRTLAQAYGQRAVAVILSGTDSDGAIGLKHIRAQGGVTIAQDPSEAEYDSMPLTAISTGMVDWVLPVSAMPAKLLDYVSNEDRMKLPPELPEAEIPDAKDQEAAGGETVSDETRAPEDESALNEVLAHLRTQTGHDFMHYKRATILRRIARRLQVNSIETIPNYLAFLRKHPAENRALLQDLLIGVTHFFRDQESFAALESNIPQLFAGKHKDDQLRIWVTGCATGEEAYSIAMLLCEYAERLDAPPGVQIFASDIDEQAIHDARDGLYPATIEADVSQERLRRFFSKDHGRYRVRKNLREKVLFAVHNVLHDAPFSRLDFISCRNLLIYLNPKAQEHVFDVFHFALRSGGLLFIGGSENSTVQGLFSPVDGKHRIYVRRSVPRRSWRVPTLPLRANGLRNRRPYVLQSRTLPPLAQEVVQEASNQTEKASFSGQERRAALFGELHLKLLEQYAPPSIVVNEEHEIIHLSEKAGRYLRFAAGEPSMNLFRVILPELQIELRTSLFRASQDDKTIVGAPQTVQFDGRNETIVLQVRRIAGEGAEKFYLVLFAQNAEPPTILADPTPPGDVTRSLDEEIQHLKEQLAATVEQYEAGNEELKASNEELQAINEEMRSATEELETSKEELQSVNEELTTVNNELKSSVEDLSKANADLNNLMSSSDIGTLFLNRELRIQRFTPAAQRIFNLLPADVGRPLSDITHKLQYDGLTGDVHQVLDHLTIIEREVSLRNDGWFLLRIAPYRTAEDRIAGVVATFFDITRRKKAEEELRASEARLRQAFEIETVGVIFVNVGAQIVTDANSAFLRMSGYSREEVKSGLVRWKELSPPEWRPLSADAMEELKRDGKTGTYQKQYQRKDGTLWWGLFSASRLSDELAVKYVIDISEQKQAEEALRESEERFRRFAENTNDVFWIMNADTPQLEYLNPAYEEMFGEDRGPILRDVNRWTEIIHPADREIGADMLPRLKAGEIVTVTYRIVRPSDGATRWIRDSGFPIRDPAGTISRVAGVLQDVTDERERSDALAESEERFRLLIEGAPDYAMFMLDPANRIIYWSAGAERVFGWSADEALGRTGELIFTPEDRARKREEKEMRIALRKGLAPDRRWHLRKDGSR